MLDGSAGSTDVVHRDVIGWPSEDAFAQHDER